jgi:hypothetical protein
MNEVMKDLTSVLMAIIGVAILAVLVSRQSNTTGVINSASSAYNTGLATAMGPVTGYSPGAPIYANSGGFGSLFANEGSGAGFYGQYGAGA